MSTKLTKEEIEKEIKKAKEQKDKLLREGKTVKK